MTNSIDIREAVQGRADFMPEVRTRVIGPQEVKKDASLTQPVQQSNQVSREDYANAFTTLGALDPAYDPEMLALIFEHSNSLRQNIDSFATNIDGFGHRFDPVFDLEAADVDVRIAHAMVEEAERTTDDDDADPPLPDANAIAEMKKKIARVMRKERVKLEHFFEFCVPDQSFVTLRRWTRQDLEVMGNAYWEVLRNGAGDVAQFIYIPGFTIRLLPLDMGSTEMRRKVRVSELAFEEVTYNARLRRYVQVVEGKSCFFKEFGDPRLISAESGMAYDSIEEMKKAENDHVVPATEILHFKIHSPRTPYGVPRWIGNLLAVIGSRQAEEVNFNYFENKSVPPLAVLISGGRMTESSVKRVTDYVEANIKGKRNFHKILVLEAEGPGGDNSAANSARMKVDIKPLTGAQQSDALFQNYDERNIDKVGQSFRLPRMLRGDIRDFNRSTAEAALTFAEVQVFEPERQEFDFIINRKILHTMGVRFWRFVSLAPVLRDAASMSEIIRNLANANVLTPEECRELAGDVFNRSFRKLTADWVKQPGAFTVAGIPVQAEKPIQPDGTKPDSGEGANFEPSGGSVAPDKEPGEGTVEQRRKRTITRVAKGEAARLLALRKALGLFEHEAWYDWLESQNKSDAAAE